MLVLITAAEPKTVEADSLHGTYNSTLWLSAAPKTLADDDDPWGAITRNGFDLDLYYPTDREKLGLSEVTGVRAEGDGLTIDFFHGRKDPAQDMQDWGESGPAFPVRAVNIDPKGLTITHADGREQRLDYVHGDLLEIDGVFYGDFSIGAAEVTA